ncbi:sensor histidine kinase [Solimonas flava]|uniref:sensor histidine kinase n=1 Tax=Solimonas flava TaxID=415849 RepID=UPI00041AE35F|nr:ATP-binding protein [Solimonas flava]
MADSREDEGKQQRPAPAGALPLEGVDEAVWLDVIQRMDEVYSRLVEDEVALERKNDELEQSNRFISSVLASMSDFVAACGDDGCIQQLNPALAELVGRSATELLGTPFCALLRETDVERLRRCIAQTAREGRSTETLDVEMHDAQGGAVPVEIHVAPRQDAGGAVAGHVLVGRPVGELRRAYQQLQDAHAALKSAQQQLLHSEKMASLGRLVAGVAHELNNPISFVLGNVHALSRYAERVGRYLEVLHAEPLSAEAHAARARLKIDRVVDDLPGLIAGTVEGAQRTAEIVAGLKRFSAVSSEEVRPVALRETVERAVHWVRKGAAARFTVELDIDSGLVALAAPGPLLQVFMNLVQNASDATAAAGVETPRLRIDGRRVGDAIELCFADNGPGVPEALHSRIFDPFFTTKPVGKGTGLGLSISYGIVEQFGGRLALVDSPAGARFCVTLPAARTAA